MRRALLILLLPALLGSCAALDAGGAERTDRVVRVVDGDTLELRQLGKARLIGVDTPEVYGGAECFGPEASAYTKRRLPGGTSVDYEFGVEERDRYGRRLVYLDVDGRMLNEDLIEGGYATPLAIEPNTRYEERFARLARQAADAERGLWGACSRP